MTTVWGDRVLIVGSRDYPDLQRVADFVAGLPDGVIVVSGNARGVDRAAESAARVRGLQVDSVPADWARYGRSAGYRRNTEMVESRPARCVAFWNGISRGTMHTVNACRRIGVPVRVVGPDGEDGAG